MCSFWLVLWGMVLGKDFFDMFSEKIPVVRTKLKIFLEWINHIDEPLANELVNDNPQLKYIILIGIQCPLKISWYNWWGRKIQEGNNSGTPCIVIYKWGGGGGARAGEHSDHSPFPSYDGVKKGNTYRILWPFTRWSVKTVDSTLPGHKSLEHQQISGTSCR